MKRKALSIVLCFLIALTSLSQNSIVLSNKAFAPEVKILYDSAEVSNIVVPQNEKRTLEVFCDPESDDYEFSWQILADIPTDLWVNIHEQNEQTIDVSYALTSALVDEAGGAYLRCIVKSENFEVVSDEVCVTTSFSANTNSFEGADIKIASFNKLSDEPTSADEYVYVTVNYLDGLSGEAIYSPYTAKLENGTAFHQNILSPTFLGYAPFWNSNQPDIAIPINGTEVYAPDSALTLDISRPALSENLTINVYYKAVDVPYAVRYFFQNIYDDMYTENIGLYYTSLAKTGTIVSDEELINHAGNTCGFTALYHYPENVAADGSTVFECYYDRNYRLIKFDMNGGYGVEPIYARYATPFLVNEPVRPGYIFKGWDLFVEDDLNGDGLKDGFDGIINLLPSTIPDQNQSYKAIWATTNAQVIVVYWRENPDDNNFSYWGKKTVTAPSASSVSGEAHKALPSSITTGDTAYFTYLYADKNILVKGDNSTIVNVYYSRNRYTVNFKDSSNTKCSLEEHIHNENCYVCPETHIHTSECHKLLNCRKTEHTHSTNCNTARNDNYIFSHTAKFEATIGDIWPTADKFPGRTFYGWSVEGISARAVSKRINMTTDLCDTSDNIKIATADFQNYSTKYLFYMFESFDQTSGANGNERRLINGKYYDKSSLYSQSVLSNSTFNLKQILGMTGTSTSATVENNNQFLYYNRNSYTLDFINYSVTVKSQSVKYEQPITPYVNAFGVPPYPATLEENAYEFAGWFTTPDCIPGTEFKTNQKMPAGNLGLYAKWAPVSHTVNFFRTYDDMLAFENGIQSGKNESDPEMQALIFNAKIKTHGQIIGSVDNPSDLSGFNYTFGGWFFMNAGSKTAFTPLDMPVTRSLNVFADWGSLSAQPYTVQYVLKEKEADSSWLALLEDKAGGAFSNNLNLTVVKGGESRSYVYLSSDAGWHRTVANPTKGYAYQGSTRTFLPKTGNPYNQLYGEYNSGYFPTLASHSITMQYEENKEVAQHNVFTFTYVYATNVRYKVRYVDKNTGQQLVSLTYPVGHEEKLTSLSIVTERFRVYENYLPDSFYKRLIIAVELDPSSGTYVGSSENEIIFHYSQNASSSFYAVHHMLQKAGTSGNLYKTDGSGDYTESDSHIEGIGDKGSAIDIEPLSFSGFSLVSNRGIVKISGVESNTSANISDPQHPKYTITISSSGTELYIFYQRNSYHYKAYYLRYGTDISNLAGLTNSSSGVLADIKNATAEFGVSVTENAALINGMSCVSAIKQSLTIRANETQNVFIFFYTPLQYAAEYKVWDKSGGTLSRTLEVTEGNTPFSGSSAIANTGYVFAGWYLDKECTISALYDPNLNPRGRGTIVGDSLVPYLPMLSPSPEKNTFYAKFTPLFGSITIKRSDAADEGIGEQVFVYKITSKSEPTKVIYTTITGNGTVTISDLLYGEYIISQENSWSWRYDNIKFDINLNASDGHTVSFSENSTNEKWISGNSPLIKNKKESSP